jgi:hypothetical protein
VYAGAEARELLRLLEYAHAPAGLLQQRGCCETAEPCTDDRDLSVDFVSRVAVESSYNS